MKPSNSHIKKDWGMWLPVERHCHNLGEIVWLIVLGGGKKKESAMRKKKKDWLKGFKLEQLQERIKWEFNGTKWELYYFRITSPYHRESIMTQLRQKKKKEKNKHQM